MESITVVWPIITGGLIVPLVSWLKTKIPQEFPIGWFAVQAVLNIAAMIGLFKMFGLPLEWAKLLELSLAGIVSSTAVHAAVKTTNKVGGKS